MLNTKKVNTLLYIAIVSPFIATLISYNLPRGINEFAAHFLPARMARRIDLIMAVNPLEFSSLTIGFVGVLITFGIFAGVSLLFLRRKNDTEG